jgi:hypothetical protein
MPNYQLYRTNIKLGGQMKWDIILRTNNNVLVVDDFHLTPVSDNTPYNRFTKENLLNNNHLYNIKSYYSKLEGSFYKDYADPKITSLEPLIVDENYGDKISEIIDDHDSTLEYGLRRMSYAIYNNQFSFFCPIWLSSYDPSKDKLEFILTIYSKDGEKRHTIVKKHINFENQSGVTTHDKFVNYFNEFESSIQSTNNNILKIDLKNKKSYIRGIDVKNGVYVGFKDISNVVDNILHGERLLMDTDALIIDNFESNKLVACQLLNFNFVFDIEEIIPINIVNTLYGANITADMVVKYNGEQLELKDFYSNYDYIACKPANLIIHNNIIGGEGNKTCPNIFDLVKDNENVDLLDKNKIVQNIIHWSLDGNNDYIFNFYTGFGGYIENPETERHSTNYQDSIDIWTTIPSKTSAGWNWLYAEKINTLRQFQKIYNNPSKKITSYTTLGDNWLNGIYFKKTIEDTRYRCIVLHTTDENLYNDCLEFLGKTDDKNIINNIIIKESNDLKNDIDKDIKIKYIIILDFVSNNTEILSEDLIFKNFKKILSNWLKNHKNDDLSNIYKWMSSVEEPSVYTLSPLGYHRADGPSLKSTELNHYIMKDALYSLIRYDGHLQPCFVDITLNNYYTKKLVNDKNTRIKKYKLSDFTKYEDSGFKKVYPSRDYYPWNHYNIQKSNDLVCRNSDNQNYNFKDDKNFEYRFFGNNQMIALKPNFIYNLYNVVVNDNGYHVTDKSTDKPDDIDKTPSSVKELIINNVLAKIYNIYPDDDSDDYLEYIYNKYDISVDWTYNTENNIKIYNYKITFVLK